MSAAGPRVCVEPLQRASPVRFRMGHLWVAAELGGQSFDLLASVFERARAVDLFGGMAELFGFGKLRGNPAAGVFVGEAAGAETLELLLGTSPGDNQAVKFLVITGFDEQRSLCEGGGTGVIARPFIKLPVNEVFDAWVKDGVEAG